MILGGWLAFLPIASGEDAESASRDIGQRLILRGGGGGLRGTFADGLSAARGGGDDAGADEDA
jgi:hypothetical protein